MVKPFSRSLYDENDKKAKDEVKVFFTELGYVFDINTKELYKKGDIYATDPQGKTVLIETEIKKVWIKEDGWEIKWDTIHIPYRKKDSEAYYHIMFNTNQTALAMIKMDVVKAAEVITKSTKYTFDEQFFSLPYQSFDFYHKEDGKWVKNQK